jgi:hypothetical protein
MQARWVLAAMEETAKYVTPKEMVWRYPQGHQCGNNKYLQQETVHLERLVNIDKTGLSGKFKA